MVEWLLVPLGYLLGSISSAIIVCRAMGLPDPREQGSGNPGATNVMRIGGKKAAAITLLGDMLKGLAPVLMAQALNVDPLVLAGVVLAAFLGHLYPVFFGFAGGKGVATSLGVLLGANWVVGGAVLLSWYFVQLFLHRVPVQKLGCLALHSPLLIPSNTSTIRSLLNHNQAILPVVLRQGLPLTHV